jgi:hypothetical protein
MLTLIGVAITLVIGRWMDFKGLLHKIAMPLMIIGCIVITLAVWMVVPFEPYAHIFIYIGAVPALFAALLLVIFTWGKLIRERIAQQGIEKATVWQKLMALFHDPLKFGATWQMVFMNFNATFVGIFMAVTLEKTMRVMPAREESITLTGHWHILASIMATIILMYYADICGLRGRVRQWFGWILIIGSDIAFGSMTAFSLKRLFITEYAQQTLVDTLFIFADIGLSAVLIILAALLIWRLIDLFSKDGLWRAESDNPELEVRKTSPPLSPSGVYSGQEVK